MIPRRVRPAWWGVVLATALWACGGEPPSSPAPAKAPPVRKPAPKARKAATPSAAEEAPAFVYDPEGLRDPFQPFIRIEPEKKEKKPPDVFVPKTPLQRFAVEELRVAGIVWGPGKPARALVEAPDGKGYVVRVGTLVGDRGGKIVAIHPDRVVVEERVVDLLGEVQARSVDLRLHTPEDEVRP